MNLAHHLRSWSPDQLAHLMEARPDLLPASDRGLDAVARKAGTAISLGRSLVGADVGMLVVAEAVVAIEPATIDELDELLGTNDTMAIIEVIERLRARGITVVDDGIVRAVGSLGDLLHRPLGLGPSFVELADHLPTDALEALAVATKADGGGRSATIRAVARRLREPEVVARLVEGAPDGVAELLAGLVADRSPAIALPTGFPYRTLNPDDPMRWLLETGLVAAVTETGAELPRELVIAAHPDGLAPRAALRPIELAPTAGLGAEVVAGVAADAANRMLDGAETLLRLAGRGEISLRKAGGVGPREISRLAKISGLGPLEVTRLLELLAVGRLLRITGGAIVATDLAARWWSLHRRRRYVSLVRAWIAADHFLSRGLSEADVVDRPGDIGGASSGAGSVALGAAESVAAAASARAIVLSTICRLEPGFAYDPEQLAAAVVWRAPNLWGPGQPPPERLVAWTTAEAELLGLVAHHSPGPVLRALVDDDESALTEATDLALADDQTTVVLQADLTALALGPLAPGVARPLAEMTDRVPADDDRAPTFRFSESSIRRALDAGWAAESLVAFLTEHALAGVPQPLEYLIADVARRHGSVRVLASASVIVTDDDVGAVEIATNRKAASLGLRLIAPTVLTSPLDPLTVTEALRTLGFLPVLDGEKEAITVAGAGSRAADPAGHAEHAEDLPADWTGPPVPVGPFPDEVADAVATLLDPLAGDRIGPTTGSDGGRDEPGLQLYWGRPVLVRAQVDGRTIESTGTVVGLGEKVSLLTTVGVIEIPTASIASLDHLHRT